MSGFGFSSSSNGGASKISNMNDQARCQHWKPNHDFFFKREVMSAMMKLKCL